MKYETDLIELKSNPFKIYYPNTMSPNMFWNLISEEHSWINKIRERNDIFIKGSRGSGKSTLIYYFKSNFLIEKFKNIHRFLDPKINSQLKIFGLYFDCKKHFEQGNKLFKPYNDDFDKLKYLKTSWCGLDLFLKLILCLFDEIKINFKEFLEKLEFNDKIKNELNFLIKTSFRINIDSIDEQNLDFIDHINKINNLFLEIQTKNIDELNTIIFNSEEDFQFNLSSINIQDLGKFVKFIKNIIPGLEDFSFFILIDDGDRLNQNYQKFLNLLIKPRDHHDYCVKISLEKGWDSWSFSYTTEDHIQFPHDYDIIDLNELYSNNLNIYSKQIIKICEKRFNVISKSFNFEDFFPYSVTQIKNIEEEKKIIFEDVLKTKFNYTIEKYTNLEFEKQSEIRKKVNNHINKYLNVYLFRKYKKKHSQIPYAGYKNITYISSGIIRDFLAYTNRMYEEEKRDKPDEEITFIKPSIQTKIINEESEQKITYLDIHIKKETSDYNKKIYTMLKNLILNIGFFFQKRFYLTKLKDVRLFSFTIKDYENLSNDMKNVFKFGTRENYFHEYYQGTKDGMRKVKGYTLHRLLLPYFSLDPTSLRGRVEFNSKKIEKFTEYTISNTTLDRFLRTD